MGLTKLLQSSGLWISTSVSFSYALKIHCRQRPSCLSARYTSIISLSCCWLAITGGLLLNAPLDICYFAWPFWRRNSAYVYEKHSDTVTWENVHCLYNDNGKFSTKHFAKKVIIIVGYMSCLPIFPTLWKFLYSWWSHPQQKLEKSCTLLDNLLLEMCNKTQLRNHSQHTSLEIQKAGQKQSYN